MAKTILLGVDGVLAGRIDMEVFVTKPVIYERSLPTTCVEMRVSTYELPATIYYKVTDLRLNDHQRQLDDLYLKVHQISQRLNTEKDDKRA